MDEDVRLARDYFDCDDHDVSFVTLQGSGRVLLSAPHAVTQTRNGQRKYAERSTGMLCLLMNQRYGVPCIYKATHLNDDANFDPQSDYRDALCAWLRRGELRFVLDLHQLAPTRPMALCIGTGEGLYTQGMESTVTLARQAFERRGLAPVTLDDPYSALYAPTICAAAHGMGICSLLLELNTRIVMPEDGGTFMAVLDALHELVQQINALLNTNGR